MPSTFHDGPLPGTISGDDAQVVEFAMTAGQRLTCEGSSILYLMGAAKITMEWGDGVLTPLWRKYAGEDLLLTEIIASGDAVVGLSPGQWGRILRIPLREGGVVFTGRGAYMAHTGQIVTEVSVTRRVRAGFFGGTGVVFQRHVGHGDLFIHAYGAVLEMDLPKDKSIRVSPGNVVAFEGTVGLDAQMSSGPLTLLMGRQEAVLDELRGPGKVWLQSLDMKPKISRPGKQPPEATQ